MCQVCLSIQWQPCAKCEQHACQYNASHVPSVSSMPVNTMAVMCQVWAACLSIQWQPCAKCEQHACQYNGSRVPSMSSMPINTMAVMCQVWVVCLSIQWQSRAKCEQRACQYNGSHMPVCLLSMLGPFLLKSKAWMCPRHTECPDSLFQSKNTAPFNSFNTFNQNISRLQSNSGWINKFF
jgi:hypothetical protein